MAHRVSPQAEADPDEIWLYIASGGNLEAADRFVDSLTARFLLLAAHPAVGRQRDDLSEGLRLFPVGDYVVLYRVQGSDVSIVRVVRGSRDLGPLFDPDL